MIAEEEPELVTVDGGWDKYKISAIMATELQEYENLAFVCASYFCEYAMKGRGIKSTRQSRIRL